MVDRLRQLKYGYNLRFVLLIVTLKMYVVIRARSHVGPACCKATVYGLKCYSQAIIMRGLNASTPYDHTQPHPQVPW